MASPSREDYLEAIWILARDHGYARVSDVAKRLGISVASVSKMVRRLDEAGYLRYERYRGLALTPHGEGAGRRLAARHALLEDFLRLLGVADAARVYETVEGIEHYVDADTLFGIETLLGLAAAHPEWWARYQENLARRHAP